MDPSYDRLVLKRVLNDETLQHFFVWTERGNAQTRTHEGTNKDQSLFLKGFLMTASPAVWKARKKEFILRQASHETSTMHARPRLKGKGKAGGPAHRAADSDPDRSDNYPTPSCRALLTLTVYPFTQSQLVRHLRVIILHIGSTKLSWALCV